MRKIYLILLTLITLFAVSCNEDITGNGGNNVGDSGGTTSGGMGGNTGGSSGGTGENTGGSSGVGSGFDAQYRNTTWTSSNDGTFYIDNDGSLTNTNKNHSEKYEANKITKESDGTYVISYYSNGGQGSIKFIFQGDGSCKYILTLKDSSTGQESKTETTLTKQS